MWGRIAKTGVKTQRWGQNAKVGPKRKELRAWVGSKRKEISGGEQVLGFYDREKLMDVVKDRGYTTQRAVADAIAPVLGVSRKTAAAKLYSGTLSKEECEVIGSIFRMTMKEYYDVFMHGLFREDMDGHYVCRIDDTNGHLFRKPRKKKTAGKSERETIVAQVREYGG